MKVGFAAKHRGDVVEEAARKLRVAEAAPGVCANDVTEAGSGFGTDTNRVTLLGRDGPARGPPPDEQGSGRRPAPGARRRVAPRGATGPGAGLTAARTPDVPRCAGAPLRRDEGRRGRAQARPSCSRTTAMPSSSLDGATWPGDGDGVLGAVAHGDAHPGEGQHLHVVDVVPRTRPPPAPRSVRGARQRRSSGARLGGLRADDLDRAARGELVAGEDHPPQGERRAGAALRRGVLDRGGGVPGCGPRPGAPGAPSCPSRSARRGRARGTRRSGGG